MAATAQASRYIVERVPITPAKCLPFAFFIVAVIPLSGTAGQQWTEVASIPLEISSNGLTQVAVPLWDEGFYFLNNLSLEVLVCGANGQLRQRYGGWGAGALSLDLPRSLALAENSVFVLDQGQHRIIRLDTRLNPVSVTPLPSDNLPAAFIRDSRQRFWVAFENQAGLYIYDDRGRLVDVAADEASGSAVILHPDLLAASPTAIAVWDQVDALICLLRLSGQVYRRLLLPSARPIVALEWIDEQLIAATSDEILQIDPSDGATITLLQSVGIVDLTYRSPLLYVLDQAGSLRVFQQIP